MTERERGEEDDEEGCYTAKVLRLCGTFIAE